MKDKIKCDDCKNCSFNITEMRGEIHFYGYWYCKEKGGRVSPLVDRYCRKYHRKWWKFWAPKG